MDFNEPVLYKEYKNIVKTCIQEGYALPVLIKDKHIPQEYKYNLEEKQTLFDNTTDEAKEKLYNMLNHRGEIVYSILQKTNNTYTDVMEYYEDEVSSFIKLYTDYEDIIR